MANIIYADSNYRFSDPVRLYKANDPYYYEVDNIPIRQLHENTLWLKDQLTAGTPELAGVKRSGFDDLRPSVDGTTKQVTINTGRFTGRVNDASHVPLGSMKRFVDGDGGLNQGDFAESPILNNWKIHLRKNNEGTADGNTSASEWPAWNGNFNVQELLQDVRDFNADRIYGMNGLAERAFGRGVSVPWSDQDAEFTDNGKIPVIRNGQLMGWQKGNVASQEDFIIDLFDFTNTTIGFNYLPWLENALIRQWRGVARTAVCDVPEPLTINVPAFDSNEFYYVNGAGETEVDDNVTSRIDLLFLYTKPVDAQTSRIMSSNGGDSAPGSIQKVEIGIIKGAGVGIDETSENGTQITNPGDGMKIFKMLPAPGDQNESIGINTGRGFLNTTQVDPGQTPTKVFGSFPSPDDLMNIAPLLVEDALYNDYSLVGQSILPICYVVSKQGAAGFQVEDLIDIRPFFRTAELAYNERAGLCAAHPPLSLANPAVGKREIDRLEQAIRERIDSVLGDAGDLSITYKSTEEYDRTHLQADVTPTAADPIRHGAVFDGNLNQFGGGQSEDTFDDPMNNPKPLFLTGNGSTNATLQFQGTTIGQSIQFIEPEHLTKLANGECEIYGTFRVVPYELTTGGPNATSDILWAVNWPWFAAPDSQRQGSGVRVVQMMESVNQNDGKQHRGPTTFKQKLYVNTYPNYGDQIALNMAASNPGTQEFAVFLDSYTVIEEKTQSLG